MPAGVKCERKETATTLDAPNKRVPSDFSTSSFVGWLVDHRAQTPAGDWEGDGEHTDTQVLGCQVTGYLAYGCSFLFVCLVLFLRKQIALANGIIKVGTYSIETRS